MDHSPVKVEVCDQQVTVSKSASPKSCSEISAGLMNEADTCPDKDTVSTSSSSSAGQRRTLKESSLSLLNDPTTVESKTQETIMEDMLSAVTRTTRRKPSTRYMNSASSSSLISGSKSALRANSHRCECGGCFDTDLELQLHIYRSNMCKQICENIGSPPEPFQCGVCHKTFSSLVTLGHHVQAHLKNHGYECFMCGYHFTTSTLLVQHTVLQHDIPKAFKCGLCDAAFYENLLLLSHLQDSHDEQLRVYSCAVCKERFIDITSLNSHINSCQLPRSAAKEFQCSVCQTQFDQVQALHDHVSHHGWLSTYNKSLTAGKDSEERQERTDSPSSDLDLTVRFEEGSEDISEEGSNHTSSKSQNVDSVNSLINVPNTFHSGKIYSVDCEKCRVTFNSFRDLMLHLEERQCQGFRCLRCPQRFGLEAQLLEHRASHVVRDGQEILTCEICSKQFSSVSSFLGHTAKHTEHTPLRCCVCGTCFGLPAALFLHLKMKHNISIGPVNFTSTVMFAGDESQYNSNLHIAKQHEPKSHGDGDRLCVKMEDEEFMDDTPSLRVRFPSDTDQGNPDVEEEVSSDDPSAAERSDNIYCKECDKVFETPRLCVSHMNSCHPAGMYSVHCAKCDGTFDSLNALSLHITDDKCEGYKCSRCSQSFGLECSLLKHIASHSIRDGLKDLTCEICSKKFPTNKKYIRHAEVHTTLTPMCCGICKKCYGLPKTLFKHLKTHETRKRKSAHSNSGLAGTGTVIGTSKSSDSVTDIKKQSKRPNLRHRRSVRHLGELNADVENVSMDDDSNVNSQTYVNKESRCVEGGSKSNSILNLTSRSPRGRKKLCRGDGEKGMKLKDGVPDMDIPRTLESTESENSVASLPSLVSLVNSGQSFGLYSVHCHKCNDLFDTVDALSLHVTERKCEGHKCSQCSQSFGLEHLYLKHLAAHRMRDGLKDLTCEVCSKSFPTRQTYIRHAEVHTTLTPLHCCLCEKRYRIPDNLYKHLKTHNSFGKKFAASSFGSFHGKKIGIASSDSGTGSGLESASMNPDSDSFSSRETVNMSSPSYSDNYQKRRKGKRNVVKQEVGNFSVNESSKDSVKEPFQCPICYKEFTVKRYFQEHKSRHFKNHLCNICGATFSKRYFLNQHIEVVHEKKDYKCKTCGKGFRHASSLVRHGMMHTGEKPEQCPVCELRFHSKTEVRSHMHVHRQDRPYQCPICKMRLKRKQTLRIHMVTHQPESRHQCFQCGLAFKTKDRLAKHLKLHLNKREFKCNLCAAAFNSGPYLAVHIRTHTNERPYQCPGCERSFTHRSNMMSHVKRMHPYIRTEPGPRNQWSYAREQMYMENSGVQMKEQECESNVPLSNKCFDPLSS